MIAIFDSGYGGLTVLKPILELLPQYDYLYLGDNAKAPYGIHSPETVTEFSQKAVDYMKGRGAKLIIFACNTASATALSKIKDDKIIGVIEPSALEASKVTKNGRIGVVATKTTINSAAYEKALKRQNKSLQIYTQACPLLVPFIEEGWHTKPEAISILKKYLMPLKNANIDTLILGCTHYPIMLKSFKKIMGRKVKIVTSGEITAKYLEEFLKANPELEKSLGKNKTRTYFTTDNPEEFKRFTENNLGMKIKTPTKINL
ncbi:glutamate racemase [Candidatus Peregrinibacteria bacterium CG10_big_fil_rev_8_21_14_0_10_36_19]|nr:MAG: glutamate racemase [Candidatus Peregrinibacteria bacterium CG10_big_fil_rev_8_21_14_0_10_36_19]